ncbi:hypothetical protein HanIR_Chr10g0453491 [Helianthus annuus]|nr:hypothetical protein HanIR_Chr10g0453491 [Helianthus annuus]
MELGFYIELKLGAVSKTPDNPDTIRVCKRITPILFSVVDSCILSIQIIILIICL